MIFNKGFMRTMDSKDIVFTMDRTYDKVISIELVPT